jgi:hypothetical protein
MDSSADDASADLAMLGGETLVGNLFLPVGANRSAWSSPRLRRPTLITPAVDAVAAFLRSGAPR